MELYKKYRPNSWEGLVGQERVAKSLRNAVLSARNGEEGKLPSAYLFAGPRGCGKTSASFILTKALNCENLSENGDPCNECETCQAIDNHSQIGVVYSSMANIQGVDAIRGLVNDARIAYPIPRPVFIIDEIHNASKAAFDSLLIPLEETNTSTLFIFCTTEIEKVPDTIKSRVQQRRFNLVSADKMFDYLHTLQTKEAALEKVSDEQLKEAVRRGKGSVRDTLSALDSIIAVDDDAVSDEEYGYKLIVQVAKSNIIGQLFVLEKVGEAGYDYTDFLTQTFEDFKDLYMLSAGAKKPEDVYVKKPKAVISHIGGGDKIRLMLECLSEALLAVSVGADAKIMFEIALLDFDRKRKAMPDADNPWN